MCVILNDVQNYDDIENPPEREVFDVMLSTMRSQRTTLKFEDCFQAGPKIMELMARFGKIILMIHSSLLFSIAYIDDVL